jgi:anti-sigma-K factor RskA
VTGGDDHRHWDDEVASYALGALTASEAAELEEHMAGCERCRVQLEWLAPAVAALPASVPQLEPPRRLRRRVMAAARVEPRASPEGAPTSSRWRTRLVPAAAAAVVAIALAVGIASIGGGDGGEASTVSAEVLSDRASGAAGRLITVGSEATLEVEHMPRLTPADVYEAWVQRGDRLEPSTTFIVDSDGNGAAAIPNVGGADRVMVTREPRGGSEAPTTEPLLQAPVTAS